MTISRRFESALIFAAHLHADQLRKGTQIPYIGHLLGVADIVLENGGNEDQAIAALLHDAIEDQGGEETRDRIKKLFGPGVTEIVEACTDAKVKPKPPWQERKAAYIAHIKEVSSSSVLVSAADKLHNARAILKDYIELRDQIWERFSGGREGTLWYYRALVEAFKERPQQPKSLIEELDRIVSTLEKAVASDMGNSIINKAIS